MTLYVANAVFSTFESGTGSNQLVIANGSLVLFLSGTGGGTIYTGSVGRFSASSELKQPTTSLLLPGVTASAGRFSCSLGMKFSRAVIPLKKYRSISLSFGTLTADYISQGFGIYLPYKILSALSQPNFLYLLSVNDLARGDDLSLYQSLKSSLPGDIQKRIVLINDLTEALIALQKQRNDLSGDAVKQAIAYLQTLANVDSANVSQKLSISIEDPGSLFKSVPSGIYIDGRPI